MIYEDITAKILRHNTIATGILAITCAGLVGALITQHIQYSKLLQQQTEKYTDLIITQQPDIKEFPNRKLGKFTLSWYSPKELGKPAAQLRTSTGTKPKEGRTIAVDPTIIPYGSIIYIQDYGYFIAEDCGGAIKQNRIDIYTNSHEYAIQQGKKVAQVWVLGNI